MDYIRIRWSRFNGLWKPWSIGLQLRIRWLQCKAYGDHSPTKYDICSCLVLVWDNKDIELQADMDQLTSGYSFTEVNHVRASTKKVVCCHFSSDGKLLASADHDKKVNLLGCVGRM
ncbi:hypothetical protein AMTRI_Chr05g63410 [Amborella trichopoda]